MSNELFLFTFYLLSALLLLGVSVAIVAEWKTRNPAMLFWLAVLVIYVIPSLGDPFNAYAFVLESVDGRFGWGLDLRHNPVLLRSHLFAIGFVLSYLVIKLLLYPTELRAAAASSPGNLKALIARLPRGSSMSWLTTAILMVGLALGVYSVVAVHGLGGILDSGYYSYYMRGFTPAKALSDYVLIAFGGSAFIAWSQRRYLLLSVIAAIFISQFAMSMARAIMIPLATPFVLHVLFQRWTLRRSFLTIGGFAVGYAGLVLLLVLRYEGTISRTADALKSPRFYSKVAEQLQAGEGEARRRIGYYFFMQEGITYEGFATGQSFRRLLLLPIPSAWARGIKPREITERQYDKYYRLQGTQRSNESAGQFPTLAFGDAYANFAWLGMLVGAFWAAVFGFIALAIKHAPPVTQALYYAPLGNLLLLAVRGSLYNAIARMFWCSLMILVAYWVWRLIAGSLRSQARGARARLESA